MEDNKALYDLLWSAIETDSGLWGYVWELNVTKPSLSFEEKYSVAYKTSKDLLKKGWIELHERVDWVGNYRVVEQSEYEKILSNKKYWDEPNNEDEFFYSIEATSAGEKAYDTLFHHMSK